VTDAVRAHFGGYRIDPDLYRGKIDEDMSPDPGDRVHVAACVYGKFDVLVTRNVKHFAAPVLNQAGVRVMAADDFLCELWVRRSGDVLGSFLRAVNARKNPPVTASELVERLDRAGAARFAERLRNHFREI